MVDNSPLPIRAGLAAYGFDRFVGGFAGGFAAVVTGPPRVFRHGSVSKRCWANAGPRLKMRHVDLRRAGDACPYGVRIYKMDGDRLTDIPLMVSVLNWQDFEEKFREMLSSINLTLSVSDAILLATAGLQESMQDVNIVNSLQVTRPQDLGTEKLSSMLRLVYANALLLPASERIKYEDQLTSLQLSISQEASDIAYLQSDSHRTPVVLAGITLAAGLAVYGIRHYVKSKYVEAKSDILYTFRCMVKAMLDQVASSVRISLLTLIAGYVSIKVLASTSIFVRIAIYTALFTAAGLAGGAHLATFISMVAQDASPPPEEIVQLQSDNDGSLMTWLCATLLAMVTGLTFTTVMVKKLRERLNLFSSIHKLVSISTDPMSYLAQVLPVAVREIVAMRDPMTAVRMICSPAQVMRDLNDAVNAWRELSDGVLNEEDIAMKLIQDTDKRRAFLDLFSKARVIRFELVKLNVKPPLFDQFLKDFTEIERMGRALNMIEKHPLSVVTPYFAFFSGETGCGKSFMSTHLANYVHGVAKIYTRNIRDPFWSCYNRSFNTVRFDDVNNVKVDGSDDASELFSIITNVPVPLNMPDISETSFTGTKGTIYGSPLILGLSNTNHFTSKYVQHAPALLRRRAICYRMTVLPEFQLRSGEVDPSKVNGRASLDNAFCFQQFDTHDSGPPDYCPHFGDKITFTAMAQQVKDSYENHMKREWANVVEVVESAPQHQYIDYNDPYVPVVELDAAVEVLQEKVEPAASWFMKWWPAWKRIPEREASMLKRGFAILGGLTAAVVAISLAKSAYSSVVPMLQSYGGKNSRGRPGKAPGKHGRLGGPVGHYVMQSDQITDVARKVSNNIVRVTLTGGKQLQRMHGVVIVDRLLLLPYHAFIGQTEMVVEAKNLFSNNGKLDVFHMMIDPKQAYVLSSSDGIIQDLVLIKMPGNVRLFPDIVKHMPTIDQEIVGPTQGVLTTIANGSTNFVHQVAVIRPDSDMDVLNHITDSIMKVGSTIAHGFTTSQGDCGAPIMASVELTTDKFVAVHFAGKENDSTAVGFAYRVFKEHADQAIEALGGALEPQRVVVNPRVSTSLHGDFDILGHVDVRVPVRDSKLQRSMLYAVVQETTKEPAVLVTSDERWDGVPDETPLTRAVQKYSKVPRVTMDRQVLARATNVVNCRLTRSLQLTFQSPYPGFRTLSMHEALNGCDKLKSLEMNTSPGIPYVDENLRRADLINVDDQGVKTLGARLRQDVETMETLYLSGVTGQVVWKDFSKDELLSAAKIAAGKTRHITCPSLAYNILVRKYFGHLDSALHHLPIGSGSAVGIAAESIAWDEMRLCLRDAGTHGWATDYKNFDGTIPPDVLFAVLDLLDNHLPPADKLMRRALFEEMVHTTARCGNVLYTKHAGNPSGCPLTTTINTVANLMMVHYGFLKYSKVSERNLNQSAIVAYGDDLIMVPGKGLRASGITLQHVAIELEKYGVTLLSDFDNWKMQPLHKLVFLKRTTVFSKELDAYVPLMAKETIADIMNWTRASNERNFVSNMESRAMAAQIFTFFYGKDCFDSFTVDLKEKMAATCVDFRLFTYQEIKDKYDKDLLAGIIDDFNAGYQPQFD